MKYKLTKKENIVVEKNVEYRWRFIFNSKKESFFTKIRRERWWVFSPAYESAKNYF